MFDDGEVSVELILVTRQPITLPPDADIYEAVAIFNQYNVSCIPVVDSQKIIKGILS